MPMSCGLRLSRALLGGALVIASFLVVIPCLAQDDWRVVPHNNPSEGGASPANGPGSSSSAAAGSRDFVIACGERARPAGEPLKSMMEQIASVWDAQGEVQL